MKLQLKNIEIEIPDGASVEISEDGLKVKIGGISTPEVVEKIRIVEVAGETIRYIPQIQPYVAPTYPIYTTPYIWPTTTTGTSATYTWNNAYGGLPPNGNIGTDDSGCVATN